MAGKPQYDESAVVAAAIKVFWQHGYAAASINHLTEATGLSRSSIYQRFGDKDGLFAHALAAYTKLVVKRMNSAQGSTGRERIEAMLRDFLPKKTTAGRPVGCLLARSCVERVDLTNQGEAAALDGVGQQHNIVATILRDAVKAGELPSKSNVDALAWYYLGVMQAVLNFPASGASSAAIDQMIEIAMSTWPLHDKSTSP